jgi:hypothetical protein
MIGPLSELNDHNELALLQIKTEDNDNAAFSD